ncbi:tigger transposable element-derived protein 4-like [Hetaerina americana]|uniref:tigger transposable element-derived protein 4-like n=1 Tax=Hetaerina americana TaxID=62018 RepID=UPI003A7F33AB
MRSFSKRYCVIGTDDSASRDAECWCYLDNFSGHPRELQLDNIQLVFFPPNTTANSQPMYQGIIKNLKCHYNKLLLCRQLEAMDEGKEFKFTLLDALHVARRAWEQVSKSTIRNCFAMAKYIEEEIHSEAQDAELLEIWGSLPAEEMKNTRTGRSSCLTFSKPTSAS